MSHLEEKFVSIYLSFSKFNATIIIILTIVSFVLFKRDK